ncbi:hypothetical protein FHP05_02265 [Cerasibacillus terrae]|uniref:Uncharacterized protein n=1 Tax=Cerasibacillus terrae TaxID=2498845 RepID=A0A5C8P3L3_9BACI|nr:hypothetical protein [Cerasibacillus terrae]TXL67867.1 hypothetical protein FHP05_02265 [Cerasibacillus terrae]
MTSGLMFYWLGWIFWVISYFFIKQNKEQQFFSFWILIIIGTSNIFISIGFLDFSIAYFILFFGSFLLLLQNLDMFYHLFVSFTIMVGYASYLIWENEAPFLSIFPRLFLLSALIVSMSSFLTQGLKSRCIVAIVGVCGGELLYYLFLLHYQAHSTMGSLVFLDTTIIIISSLFLLEILFRLYTKITAFFHHLKSQYIGYTR